MKTNQKGLETMKMLNKFLVLFFAMFALGMGTLDAEDVAVSDHPELGEFLKKAGVQVDATTQIDSGWVSDWQKKKDTYAAALKTATLTDEHTSAPANFLDALRQHTESQGVFGVRQKTNDPKNSPFSSLPSEDMTEDKTASNRAISGRSKPEENINNPLFQALAAKKALQPTSAPPASAGAEPAHSTSTPASSTPPASTTAAKPAETSATSQPVVTPELPAPKPAEAPADQAPATPKQPAVSSSTQPVVSSTAVALATQKAAPVKLEKQLNKQEEHPLLAEVKPSKWTTIKRWFGRDSISLAKKSLSDTDGQRNKAIKDAHKAYNDAVQRSKERSQAKLKILWTKSDIELDKHRTKANNELRELDKHIATIKNTHENAQDGHKDALDILHADLVRRRNNLAANNTKIIAKRNKETQKAKLAQRIQKRTPAAH